MRPRSINFVIGYIKDESNTSLQIGGKIQAKLKIGFGPAS